MNREEIEKVLAALNPGDEIELTFRRRVIDASSSWVTTKEPGGGSRDWRPGDLWRWQGQINVVSRCLPEPPVGSVVLDRDGDAYQRGQHTWEGAAKRYCVSWESLKNHYGPVRVIYTPEEV